MIKTGMYDLGYVGAVAGSGVRADALLEIEKNPEGAGYFIHLYIVHLDLHGCPTDRYSDLQYYAATDAEAEKLVRRIRQAAAMGQVWLWKWYYPDIPV